MASIFTRQSDEGFADNLAQLDALGLLGNIWEGARDEWLGIDDLIRLPRKIAEGDLGGALRSGGAAAFELGTSLVPLMSAAKLATKGKKAQRGLRLLGAGSKTPARGVAGNIAGYGAGMLVLPPLMGIAAPVLNRIPGVNSLLRYAAGPQPIPVNLAMSGPSPYAGVSTLLRNSPDAASNEAMIRMAMEQGLI